MAETAALLVRHRLPEVPWRQWVLSFEGPMSMRLGYDPPLLGRLCQRFAKRVMQTLRARTKCAQGLRSSGSLHTGADRLRRCSSAGSACSCTPPSP